MTSYFRWPSRRRFTLELDDAYELRRQGIASAPCRFNRRDAAPGADLPSTALPGQRWAIRSYSSKDAAQVLQLHYQCAMENTVEPGNPGIPGIPGNPRGPGDLSSAIEPSDTATDLQSISDAYLSDERSHFWVAEDEQGEIVGMVGVMQAGPSVAEIRRFSVVGAWQTTELSAALIRKAVTHCRRHGFLKVSFDAQCEGQSLLQVFNKQGCLHTRSKLIRGQEVLEFYLNLYHHIVPERPEKWAFA